MADHYIGNMNSKQTTENKMLGPNLLNVPRKLMAPAKAEAVAAVLNATDDWTYTVVHCPNGTGFSYIEIYDEDGFVSYWK